MRHLFKRRFSVWSCSAAVRSSPKFDTLPTRRLLVAPNGNDAWSGKAPPEQPMAAMARWPRSQARRNAVRKLKAQGPLTETHRRSSSPKERIVLDEPVRLHARRIPERQGPVSLSAFPARAGPQRRRARSSGWQKGREGGLWTTDVPRRKGGQVVFPFALR